MGICRGINTRFQYCGARRPPAGVYPNVCGASVQNFNPNTPKDNSIAIKNAKLRRVLGNRATYLNNVLNNEQTAGNNAAVLGNTPFNGRTQQKDTCITSTRAGGVGGMYNRLHGRAKRCYASGCHCPNR